MSIDLYEQREQLIQLIDETLNMYSTMKLDVLLSNVMTSATKIMRAEASSLMLLDEETEELVFEVALGVKKSLLSKIRIKSGDGIAGWVAREGIPLLVSDVTKDSRFSSKVDELTGFKTKSILCVPLKVENKLIGVLEVVNRIDGGIFLEEDIRLFTLFSNLAAICIQNSKIYTDLQDLILKEAQNQINRLDVMSQVSGIPLSSMDFSKLLKVMLEIVIQAINVEAGVIYLISEKDREIFPIVFRGFHEGVLIEKQQLKVSEQIVQEVIKTCKPFKIEGFIDNVSRNEHEISMGQTQVVIGFPMKTSQKIIGAIVIFSRKGEAINQQDVDFLKNFSKQTALSLEKIDIKELFGKFGHKFETYKKASFFIKGEEQRLQLKSLAEYIQDGLIICDEDFNIQLVNKKAEIILGISEEDLIKQNCVNCHSPSLHNTVKEINYRFKEDKELNKMTFTKRFPSENKTVIANIVPIRDPFLNLRGFLMFMVEIEPEVKKDKKKSKKKKSIPKT
ncbi:MAG TPA: GAF domain-containing protein [Candidatus Eremiobacteraeota bacterium]|nr:GAF domain-containing protein [Candidatus Eremiobacteraeota bacterium]